MIRATLITDDGILARVKLDGDRFEVDPGSVKKAAGLANASLRDVGRLIAQMPLDEHGTARVDLT
jgi:hypothetical protein